MSMYLCAACWTTYDSTAPTDDDGHITCPSCGNGTYHFVESLLADMELSACLRSVLPKTWNTISDITQKSADHEKFIKHGGEAIATSFIRHIVESYGPDIQRIRDAAREDLGTDA